MPPSRVTSISEVEHGGCDAPRIQPLGEPLRKRHAGVSVLGCAIAMVAGGCAQGVGHIFAALVNGMARSPSMKGSVHVRTHGDRFSGILAIVVILIASLLLYSG